LGGTGILVGGSRLSSENTVRAEGPVGILLRGNGCKVFDNVVSRCTTAGIQVDPGSFAKLIWRNVIREVTGGPAILVQGDQNEIAGNVMNNNACGLEFVAGADNNVYRENMARLNTGGLPVCAAMPCAPNFGNLGVGNSTAGNNFVPSGAAPCN
jgi:nitrous oxidase accessory protein NosD